MTSVNLKNTLKFFRSKKAYGLKIIQNILYVKEHFHMFFLPWKILYKHKIKQIIELAKSLN